MPRSILSRFGTCLATLCCLTDCSGNSSPPGPGFNETGGGTSMGGTSTGGTSTGATTSTGGTSTGATTSTGGTSTGATTSTGGISTGATTSTGGISTGGTSTGATTSTGGISTGGTSTGATTSTGGTSTGGASTGGVSTGATTSTGGVSTGGTEVDCKGQALASPGDRVSTSGSYLNLGEMRLINNRWGSDALACSGTTMSVFANSDQSLGWDFNRPTCGGADAYPDYPELEFGVAPFGTGNDASLLTSPSCSSTTLLPIQIKDITSASIQVTNFNISLPDPNCGCTVSGSTTTCTCSWNLGFEFWLSKDNPITNPNPEVYAELIGFWGWQGGRWPCDAPLTSQTVSSDGKTYHLCHQADNWHTGTPQWRYFQFWDSSGSHTSFNGKVDIKAFLDWMNTAYGVSKDLWLTRLELGTEIDDKTSGSVSLQDVAFEINGVSKSPLFAQ